MFLLLLFALQKTPFVKWGPKHKNGIQINTNYGETLHFLNTLSAQALPFLPKPQQGWLSCSTSHQAKGLCVAPGEEE